MRMQARPPRWASARPRTRRALYAVRGTLVLVLLLLPLVACTLSFDGPPAPAGSTYACYPTVCQQDVLFRQADGDLSGTPWIVESTLRVVPLSCDVACRASTRDPGLGYISNFMELVDSTHNPAYFIRLGYHTNPNGYPSSGVPTIFVEAYLPDLPGGYFIQELVPTGITRPGDSQWGYFGILAVVTDKCPMPQKAWQIQYPEPFQSRPNGDGRVSICGDFTPDMIVFGQALKGTSGATAEPALFTNNLYATMPVNYSTLVNYVTGYNLSFLTHNGTLQNTSPPPFVGWSASSPPPSDSTTGGAFFTVCCTPSGPKAAAP